MEILHGVSITLGEGELITIIGPNGAGKSTLVKAIFGLIRVSGGQVVFRGKDITGYAPRKLVMMGLGCVPQTNNTFPTLTVLENLEMGAITRRNSPLTWSPSKSLRRLSRNDPLIPPEARASPGRETETSGRDTPTQSRLMTDAQIRKRAVEIIELFPNLEPKLREPAGALSGGEQQMVALAKSMMLDPDVDIQALEKKSENANVNVEEVK